MLNFFRFLVSLFVKDVKQIDCAVYEGRVLWYSEDKKYGFLSSESFRDNIFFRIEYFVKDDVLKLPPQKEYRVCFEKGINTYTGKPFACKIRTLSHCEKVGTIFHWNNNQKYGTVRAGGKMYHLPNKALLALVSSAPDVLVGRSVVFITKPSDSEGYLDVVLKLRFLDLA